jgi:hypothetical protein
VILASSRGRSARFSALSRIEHYKPLLAKPCGVAHEHISYICTFLLPLLPSFLTHPHLSLSPTVLHKAPHRRLIFSTRICFVGRPQTIIEQWTHRPPNTESTQRRLYVRYTRLSLISLLHLHCPELRGFASIGTVLSCSTQAPSTTFSERRQAPTQHHQRPKEHTRTMRRSTTSSIKSCVRCAKLSPASRFRHSGAPSTTFSEKTPYVHCARLSPISELRHGSMKQNIRTVLELGRKSLRGAIELRTRTICIDENGDCGSS